MSTRWAFINDDFVLAENATLLISDLSVQRGYGVFDFFRVIDNVPIYLNDHLNRFYNSADKMRLAVPYSRIELTEIIHRLINKNNFSESGIRITLTGGYSSDGYSISKPNLILYQQLLKSCTLEEVERGLRLITYDYQRELPYIKTINYAMAIWLQPIIKLQGADDVLYHKKEIVTECPRSNIFIVTKDEIILTPSENILHGITRGKVLEIAGSNFLVEERDITVNDVKNTREVFISNTTKRILPVLKVDDTVINNGKPGPITLKLRSELISMDASLLT